MLFTPTEVHIVTSGKKGEAAQAGTDSMTLSWQLRTRELPRRSAPVTTAYCMGDTGGWSTLVAPLREVWSRSAGLVILPPAPIKQVAVSCTRSPPSRLTFGLASGCCPSRKTFREAATDLAHTLL